MRRFTLHFREAAVAILVQLMYSSRPESFVEQSSFHGLWIETGEWRQSTLRTCALGACSQFFHDMSFPSYLIKRTCKLQAYHSHTVQSEKHFLGYGLCSEAPLALGATRIISSSSTDDWGNDPSLLLTALVHSSWTLPTFLLQDCEPPYTPSLVHHSRWPRLSPSDPFHQDVTSLLSVFIDMRGRRWQKWWEIFPFLLPFVVQLSSGA